MKEPKARGESVTSSKSLEITADGRILSDRREFGWKTVVFGFLRSRRRSHRRSTDEQSLFVDWHHPWLFFLATGTMLLSSLDALFTLELINRGAVEANPFMALAIDRGISVFAASKMFLTAIGLLMLVYLSRSTVFDRLRTGLLLTVFFSMYACLVCYQFVLLLQPM